MEEYTLCCFVPGAKDTFPVDINEGMTVGQLKKAIKNEKPIAFKDVDAADLTLHQIKVDVSNKDEYEDIIFDVSQPGYVFIPKHKLFATWEISEYFREPSARPRATIHILVEPPQTPNHKRARSESDQIRQEAVNRGLLFCSQKRGTDHFTEHTLISNDIRLHQSDDEPVFVSEILAKLKAKRFITAGKQHALQEFKVGDNIIAEHFNSVPENDNRCPDEEVGHLICLFTEKMSLSSLDRDAARHRIGNNYFRHIGAYLYERYPNRGDFKREANWPLKFVAEVTDEIDKYYSYQPRSDFLFSLAHCPRIQIEVCSDPLRESDRYRLLLQAGLLVRIMNTIRGQGDSFISIAVYISRELTATWYLVYQPGRADRTIEYTQESFDLNSSLGKLQFFHRLYNFPSAFPPGDDIVDVEGRLAKLKALVDEKSLEGFTSRPKITPPDGDQAPPGGDHMQHLHNPSTSQMLSKAGYKLLPEYHVEGWSSFNPLPPTVCRARGPINKDGGVDEELIFKFVEQDEFDIHSFLLESKLSGNHTVPILESFTCACGLGKFIVMKEDVVLRNATAYLSGTTGCSVARQFLEGVQFIHHSLVAHLDLKPDNIVIGANTRLRIIDFSVSVRVPLLESQIKGHQGTKGWVAPEVEQNPNAGYQPIRADLWSTGQVMRYLAKHQPAHRIEIELLAEQLQNPEPRQRPLLSTIDLDTVFQRPFRYENLPLKLKRKLGVDAQGKEEVKRICVPPPSPLPL